MKRALAALVAIVFLAACGSPLAKAETPQQALQAAATRSTQLKSAKFDFTGAVTVTLPAALAQAFGQGSASSSGTMSVNLGGTGEAQFPDRYHANASVKMGGLSLATEAIVANGKAYVKNPMSGKWEASNQSQGLSQLGQPDPLSYEQLLKNVKSIKDLGDTSLNGAAVHHYQLTPDKDKLLESMQSSSDKNAQALAAMKQVLDSGTMTLEVWFGKDDHLVRKLSTDANYTVDLNQLMGSLGSAGSQSGRLPSGSTMHATAHMVINFHDFDTPVTISIPTVG